MSIRVLIKTLNLAQLALLVFLALCLVWLGYAVYEDGAAGSGVRRLDLVLAIMAAGLAVLGLNTVVQMRIFQARVVKPLDRMSHYAEGVAAGEDPQPLSLRHGDEVAGMFASLRRMKEALFTRTRQLREAERRIYKSCQQAALARSQTLASLDLAQRASSAQDDFVRRISHEIRTPLNAIIGMSYLGLQTPLSATQRQYLLEISKAGSLLLDMVNRILDFSSAREGGLSFGREAFELPQFLEFLRQSVAGGALEKKLELRFMLDPSVPLRVVGDQRHLEEALRILLDNAVTHTVSGSVGCSVRSAAPAADMDHKTRLRFAVVDSGPGMDPAQWERLAAPFALGEESLIRVCSGLGLGLPLARQLVNLMGGELFVESAPGQGSRFFFELELEVAPQETAAQPAQNADQAPAAGTGSRTVLVVEDNEINAQITGELLRQADLEVRLAANGAEAVQEARAGSAGLVLMDMQMPVMDGLEATRRIRDMGYGPDRLPIVAMTAHTDASSRLDGKNAGMNDYLTKPVDPAALYAVLEKWLPGGLERNPLRTGGAAPGQSAGGQALPPAAEPGQGSPVDAGGQAVNVEAGLATMGGNRELYGELLRRFADNYGASSADLRALLAARDYEAAARLAHTVKGVAANLGLEHVCRLTRLMESCLPTLPPDKDLVEAFDRGMAEVLQRIAALAPDVRKAVRQGELPLGEEQRAALLALLDGLPARMEADWGSAESALNAFCPLVDGTPHAGDMADLLATVRGFDSESLARGAVRLRNKLLHEHP